MRYKADVIAAELTARDIETEEEEEGMDGSVDNSVIKGLRVEIRGEELIAHMRSRGEKHAKMARLYTEADKSDDAQEADQRARNFFWIADRLLPHATYSLGWADLRSCELLEGWF